MIGAATSRVGAAKGIPLMARGFAVVDVLDAMTHDRPYRPPARSPRRRSAGRSSLGARSVRRWRRLPGGQGTLPAEPGTPVASGATNV